MAEDDLLGFPREATVAQALAHELDAFDGASVTASAGALQLVPANTERILRLEVLALVGSSLPASQLEPTPHRLRQTLNGAVVAPISGLEDPFENPFTESICYHGGSYIVLPGASAGVATRLRYLLRALHLDEVALPRSFLRTAAEIASACLLISDAVARRAGLPRVQSVPEADGSLVVPSAGELARLRAAVRFPLRDIHELMRSRSIRPETLERLARPSGTFQPSAASIDDNPMLTYPLVAMPDEYVVALPTALCDAAITGILQLATEHGCHATLEEQFRNSVWRDVELSLRILRHDPLQVEFSPSEPRQALRWGFYAFDADKIACVVLVADIDSATRADARPGPNLPLEKQLVEMQETALGLTPMPNDLLFLVVGQVAGRTGWLSLSSRLPLFSSPKLIMAESLAHISLLEKGDPLALWKYQLAQETRQARLPMAPSLFGDLNDFYYYARAGHHGYYLSDEAPPDFMMFGGGGSGPLRQELACNEDRHGVIGPAPDVVTEVTKAADEHVYIPRSLSRRAYHVDVPSLPFWVVPEPGDALADSYAEALAYWLSLFRDHLAVLTDGTPRHCLRIGVALGPAPAEAGRPEDFLTCAASEDSKIDITVGGGFERHLQGRTNVAERSLVRLTLVTIAQVFGTGHRATPDTLDRWFADRMPEGQAKRLTPIDVARHPEADTTGLPPVRLVQEADEQVVLDELGEHMRSVVGLATGPVAVAALDGVIKSAVRFLFGCLERLVRSLSPTDLLEWLISHNEALVCRDAVERLSLPGRVSCVRDNPGLVDALAKTAGEVATAAIATRFVIEYVAARPPTGMRPISVSVLDRLLAYAKYIHVFGTLGDVVHFKIAHVAMAVLGSGRLGIDNDAYGRALGTYSQSAAELRVVRASRGPSVRREEVPKELVSLGLREMLGHEPARVAAILSAIMEEGLKVSPRSPCLELERAVEVASARSGASRADAIAVIRTFALEARPAFLSPLPPHRKEDTFPWRFGRELSLLQRPLVIRTRGTAQELIWGPRQLFGAMGYRQNRVEHGSFDARSIEGRQIRGRITEARGDSFEAAVKEIVAGRGTSLRHAARVKKANGKRLVSSDGRDLGDIDVLVANPVRRRLWLLECKDLSPAATPWRLRGELENLFVGDDSIEAKHGARIEWARANYRDLLVHLGIQDHKRWQIQGFIVTDRDLLGPLLGGSATKVIPVDRLPEFEF